MIDIEDVLEFWFQGDLSEDRELWFKRDANFDQTCARFSDARDSAKLGLLDDWAATPRGALALIILLDQFSRNLHRDSAEAFAADAKAREVVRDAIARGFDQMVPPAARSFFYLPFEHSEDLTDQDRSVLLSEALGGEALDFALRHRDIIRRFGRFPHRNAALGRATTAEEAAYLVEHPEGF